MTTNTLTSFDAAAVHYKQCRSEILEAGRSEWGVDPYEWECFTRMSPIESDLWACIRSVDAVLYPQFPIGWYFADFCNPVAGVVIECDGAQWHQDAEKDEKRRAVWENYMKRLGGLAASFVAVVFLSVTAIVTSTRAEASALQGFGASEPATVCIMLSRKLISQVKAVLRRIVQKCSFRVFIVGIAQMTT